MGSAKGDPSACGFRVASLVHSDWGSITSNARRPTGHPRRLELAGGMFNDAIQVRGLTWTPQRACDASGRSHDPAEAGSAMSRSASPRPRPAYRFRRSRQRNSVTFNDRMPHLPSADFALPAMKAPFICRDARSGCRLANARLLTSAAKLPSREHRPNQVFPQQNAYHDRAQHVQQN